MTTIKTTTTTSTTIATPTKTMTTSATITRRTSSILHMLLTLQVLLTPNVLITLLTLPLATNALPITSKPIENTAENLAWQAWLMLPAEQKNQEKSRKVTPKSIFTLPFRECPPGHQLYESRCIPTVNIDQAQLLTQQLLGIVVNDPNGANNYEFDYEDEEILGYEAPQPLNAVNADIEGSVDEVAASSYDATAGAAQLPNQDAPLKFNIFQQKFPTDYESESASALSAIGSGGDVGTLLMENGSGAGAFNETAENRTSHFFNSTQFLEAVNSYLQRQANATTTTTTTNQRNASLLDLQTDSTNIATTSVIQATAQNAAASTFTLSDIDAILLPAVSVRSKVSDSRDATNAAPANNLETTAQNHAETSSQQHKVSLFKDDNAVHLVTALIGERNYDETTHTDSIKQLLKVDALLPLYNLTTSPATAAAASTMNATNVKVAEQLLTIKKTLPSGVQADAGADANTDANTDADNADDFTAGSGDSITPAGAAFTGVTDIETSTLDEAVVAAETTTTQNDSSELLQAEEQMSENLDKSEHTRSTATRRQAESNMETNMEAQELEFTTTLQPDETTSIQLDETTIIEAVDPPTIELQELQQVAQLTRREQAVKKHLRENHVVLKKSKVEPVEMAKQASTSTAAATQLPSVLTTTSVTKQQQQVDRFYYQQYNDEDDDDDDDNGDEDDNNENMEKDQDEKFNDDAVSSKNWLNTFKRGGSVGYSTTTTPKAATSEIDIERELQLINELVKGKRQPTTTIRPITTTSATTTATGTATSTTESNLKAETVEMQTATDTLIKTATATTIRSASQNINNNYNNNKNQDDEAAETDAEVVAEVEDEDEDDELKVAATTDSKAIGTTTVVAAAAAEVAATTDVTIESNAKNSDNIDKSAVKLNQNDAAVTTATTTITREQPKLTTETIQATAATPAAITTKLWSTIMPILGSETTSTETTAAAETTHSASLSNSISSNNYNNSNSSSSKPNINSNFRSSSIRSSSSNRSFRNSKIRRINDLDLATTTTTNSLSQPKAITIITTTTKTPVITTKTTTTTTAYTSESLPSPTDNTDDPFWWLPIGWRLDRQDPEQEQPLLLRFWSAFPGNQLTKVQTT